jgi:glycosyltransferase involved in cell wall biosynthesis
MRNGVDLAYYRPSPARREPGHLVFVGVMDYLPERRRVRVVRARDPARVRAHIARGTLRSSARDPTPEVQALAREPGVTVTGFVDDPRVARRASVSVAPLRIARGIQNKVLEALAMGLPVVGTTSATQGVEGEAGRDFLVSDDAPGFAAAVVQLLQSPDGAAALGQRGRAFVEGTYDWDRCLAPLDAVLQGGARQPRRRANES